MNIIWQSEFVNGRPGKSQNSTNNNISFKAWEVMETYDAPTNIYIYIYYMTASTVILGTTLWL